ncbi:MAG TPA: hypothetical protein V6C72_20090, partial [Chroococcales cyanobacterium]
MSLEYLKRLSALALVLSILLAVPFSVSLEQAALADAEVTIQQKIDVEDDSEEKDSDDDSGKSDKSAGSKKHASAADKKKEKAGDEPKLSVTEHTVVINGQPVKYRATAGYMVLKDYTPKSKKDGNDSEKDKAEKEKELKTKDKGPKSLAKMFFIAYTREDVASTTRRPVTFSFNGGPGSASVWLHMGGLGPRRASLTDRGEALPPPYRLEDNNYSWLDESDLVFIDPVSTGYSRAEIGEDPKKFHGYQEDIESVGDFIRLYLTKYKRWMSPKFIVGE